MFSPPARSLFSIVLHLSRGKYRLETLRLGRELNPDVVFSGQMFQVFGCYTHKKKGNQLIQCRIRGELSGSCDDAHHSGFDDVKCLCQTSGGTWGTRFPGALSALGQCHGEDIS